MAAEERLRREAERRRREAEDAEERKLLERNLLLAGERLAEAALPHVGI